MKNMGQARYGIIDSGLFGMKIVAGVVTGIQFTEDKPLYKISFGKDSWWTSEITESVDDIVKAMKLAPLDRVKETHGLKIKYAP